MQTIWYDIETLQDLFTVVYMTKGRVMMTSIEPEHYECVSDGKLIESIRNVTAHPRAQEILGDNPEITVIRVRDNECTAYSQFILQLEKFRDGASVFDGSSAEYHGWNSSRYDVPMMMIAYSRMRRGDLDCVSICNDLRTYSNALIGYDGPPWGLMDHLEDTIRQHDGVSAVLFKDDLRRAAHCGMHVDLASIARSDESDSKYPPGLKKEMARYGLDIVIDEAVSNDGSHLTAEQYLDLARYNANDVLGTAIIGQNSIIQAGITTRDIIRRMYPYTAPDAVPLESKRTIHARDVSAARLAGLVLVGPQKNRPQDIPVVSYMFPIANGEKVDLLEYMKEHEQFMPTRLYQFFAHFRGKDTTTTRQNWEVIQSQPVTHSAQMNCPYYRDGKPVDAYIRVSTGGAHGSVMAGLSEYSESQVDNWIIADTGATDTQKPTIDAEDVIHVDWSSFYPVMASRLEMYKGSDGVDRYTSIIEQRIAIKESLPHDHSQWTPEHHVMQENQMGLKFILNNATGAGNMHQKYALLPVDNKTLSMRLIGNMHIWCLAQRMTQSGGFVISTNTDGIYVTGITLDTARNVIHDYVSQYGLDVEPEVVERFINRDTSNRIEYQNGEVLNVNGRLRHGLTTTYTDAAIGRNIPYPLVAANAALRYMDDTAWLTTSYSRERLYNIIKSLHSQTDVEAWYHVHIGSGKRRLTVGNVIADRINRVVLTKQGDDLAVLSRRKFTKSETHEIIMSGIEKCDVQIANDTRDAKLIVVEVIKERFKDDVLVESSVSDALLSRYRNGSLTSIGTLGLRYSDGHIEVLESWKSGSLAGYPSHVGKLLNTTESLESFDMETLDLDAYTDWAESLLLPWLVTANIPSIGMKYIRLLPESLRPTSTRKRSSKIERETAKIARLYECTVSDI